MTPRTFPRLSQALMCILVMWTSTPLAMAQDGQVIQSESGIRNFEPGWDTEDFDLAGYMDSLHPDALLWYQHVQTLANPWMGGRQPGTPGDQLAADYMTWYFNRAGLEPAFHQDGDTPSTLQPFSFEVGGMTPEVQDASLVMTHQAQGQHRLDRGTHFDVLANSGHAHVELPLTFVGYGIDEGPDGYSSFREGDDLTGRVAMLLRYEPLDDYGKSRWSASGFSPQATIRSKVSALMDRNAAAIILVNPVGAVDGRTELETPASSAGFRPQVDVPVLHATPETAQHLIDYASNGSTNLETLQSEADRGVSGVQHLDDHRHVTCQVALGDTDIDTYNIGAVLPGQGELAGEWVVIGGHYDHIGYGYTGSRSGSDDLHPGADDNASGVAMVMLLADRAAADARTDDAPRRSILFMGFGGEEAGLHGSRYFVENPSIDLDRTTLMLNFDMVGRARSDSLALMGTGTAEEFDEMLPRLVEPTGLTVHATPSGRGPSDHSNFYGAEIPVLFFHTGSHPDYHTPRDHAWTVNPEGAMPILDLAEAMMHEASHAPAMLTFAESTTGGAARRTGANVRLGIMPSYAQSDQPGVLIEDVTQGTSAHDAGLMAGDVIVGWDGDDIDGGRALMDKLRLHKAGDVVTVTVMRDGASKDIPVTLKGRGQ